MDMKQYDFKTLENTYEGFFAPSFEILVAGRKIDTAKYPVSSLNVEIVSQGGAGGCSFTLESLYDAETSKWELDLLKTLVVGQKLSIRAGYVIHKDVFYGYVDEVEVEYANLAPPRIKVTGIDALGYLMSARTQNYPEKKSTVQVVKTILEQCTSAGYAKSISVGPIPTFTAELVKKDLDDYKYLCWLSERTGMSLFCVNGELIFKSVTSYTNPIISLHYGVSLVDFSKTHSLADQVGRVTVFGEDSQGKSISGQASSTTLPGDAKTASELVKTYKNIEIRCHDEFVRTTDECTRLAQVMLNARCMKFVSGTGRCLGIPELIPGRYIAIRDLGSESESSYYITKVVHDYSADGYYTTFSFSSARYK